ncbi:hypothetical protein NQ318_000083 [Aromia moschata]|uniref:C2H2-type domain-containing protein n=1 Tax=Aromia moschata TaxID=1265417 RepID=A0AAV8YB88_9CUCU|nr:hypothetical protein NQ318_000083 [Aromia moschata]
MTSQKACKLCFKESKDLQVIEEITRIREILDVLLLKMDFSLNEDYVICESCADSIYTFFEFKSVCLCSERRLVPFIRTMDGVKVDIVQVVYLKENPGAVTLSDSDDAVCRLCLKMDRCVDLNAFSENFTDDILAKCIPEIPIKEKNHNSRIHCRNGLNLVTLGFLGSLITNMMSGIDPDEPGDPEPWSPGPPPRFSLEFGLKLNENGYSVVFSVTDHEYVVSFVVRYTLDQDTCRPFHNSIGQNLATHCGGGQKISPTPKTNECLVDECTTHGDFSVTGDERGYPTQNKLQSRRQFLSSKVDSNNAVSGFTLSSGKNKGPSAKTNFFLDFTRNLQPTTSHISLAKHASIADGQNPSYCGASFLRGLAVFDIISTRDPKICLSCQTSLLNYYQFVTECLAKQENIMECDYREAIKSEELDIKTEEEECAGGQDSKAWKRLNQSNGGSEPADRSGLLSTMESVGWKMERCRDRQGEYIEGEKVATVLNSRLKENWSNTRLRFKEGETPHKGPHIPLLGYGVLYGVSPPPLFKPQTNTDNSVSLTNTNVMSSEGTEIISFVDSSYKQETNHTSINGDPNQDGDEIKLEYPKGHELIEDVAVKQYHCYHCPYVTKAEGPFVSTRTDSPRASPTKQKGQLTRHILIHKGISEVTTYDCNFCSYKAKQKIHLTRHLLVHKNASEVMTYGCSHCSFSTKRRCSLTKHMLVHKDASEVATYDCTLCSYKSKYKSGLSQHIMLIHKDISEVTTYQCALCPYKAKQKGSLTNHVLTHKDASEITTYDCDVCSFNGKRRSALTRHMLIHKDISEVTTYDCSLCSYKSKRKTQLATHMLIHKDASEITTYDCSFCSYKAKRKGDLTTHMLIHKDASEITTYDCSFCSYKSKRKTQLATHMLIHKDASEITTYDCSFCSYKAKRKYDLIGHMLIHKDASEITTYDCSYCSYKAKRKSDLTTHMLIHKNASEIRTYDCRIFTRMICHIEQSI